MKASRLALQRSVACLAATTYDRPGLVGVAASWQWGRGGAYSNSWAGVQNGNMPELDRWDSFYVIVGSAAGALIGLQFVVITLIAERPPMRAADAGAAFATPTIVYFSTTLLLSALQRVPWPSISFVAALWGLIGLSGIAYAAIIARRMRVQTVYRPELEDWLFHLMLPLGAYIMLGMSAFTVSAYSQQALFGVATAALLLLFIGIHNTWDSLVYHVFSGGP